MQFGVHHDGGLLARLVSDSIRTAYPRAALRMIAALDRPSTGVRVELEGTDRWMFVCAKPGDPEPLVRALAQGAAAVLSIDCSSAEFEAGLAGLVGGNRTFVPVPVMRWMATEAILCASEPSRVVSRASEIGLTSREREVLDLVAGGHSNREIAVRLVISTNTVRTHLHSLAVKLDSPSRTKIVAAARLAGLLSESRFEIRRQIPA